MSEKPRKPFYKRWWFIVIGGLIVLGAIGNMVGSDNKNDVAERGKQDQVVQKDAQKEEAPEGNQEEPEVEQKAPKETPTPASKEENVPREYKNALKAAQNYLTVMPFSEKGLYDQLTSEHGNKFPADAAQYAIDNLEVDYKAQALKAAKNYLTIMPMSDQELFNQLISEHGDKYTEEQAQYAIDNLPD